MMTRDCARSIVAISRSRCCVFSVLLISAETVTPSMPCEERSGSTVHVRTRLLRPVSPWRVSPAMAPLKELTSGVCCMNTMRKQMSRSLRKFVGLVI